MPVVTPSESSEAHTRRLLAWLGCALLAGGMPVHEVEEDVREVAVTLGYPRLQVAPTPSAITLALGSGQPATFEQVEGGMRLDQLAEASLVQAALRTRSISVDEALERLAVLRSRPHRYARSGRFVGGVLCGAGIALLLAPSWPSVALAAAISPATVVLMLLSGRSPLVRTLLPFFAAFVSSVVVFYCAGLGLVSSPLWTMISPIAVLLPGAMIVTGLTELAAGSMLAGTVRLGHGLTQLLLFALGLGAAVVLLDVPPEQLGPESGGELGWWAPLVGVVLVASAISLMESVSIARVPWLLVTILATFLATKAGNAISQAPWVGAFVGATVASLLSTVIEFVKPRLPRAVNFLPSFWLLVPGSLGLVSLTQVEVAPHTAVGAVGGVTVVVAAIALGVVVGASLARPFRSVARGRRIALIRRRWAERSRRRPRPDARRPGR